MRYWNGTALLAGSWLLGSSYFYPANPYAWLAAVVAAVVLLGNTEWPLADSRLRVAALALFLPAVWFASWPYRAAPLLIVLGLAAELLPIRKRWPRRLAGGVVTAGVILLFQALVLELYAAHTAYTHELPWPMPDLLAGIATLLGIDATADGSAIVMHSMRQVHRLGATWELLLDPATLLFFVGGLAMLAVRGASCHPERSEGSIQASDEILRCAQDDWCYPWRSWIANARRLALVVVAWLPVRAGLLMALYLHRVLRSDPDRPLHAMNHFFSPWTLLLLLIVPVLLAWRFVRVGNQRSPASIESEDESARSAAASTRRKENGTTQSQELDAPPPSIQLGTESPHPLSLSTSAHRLSIAAGLIALAVALFTAAISWCPTGARKDGRVMVVERHSKWEPTTKPYDTNWFAEPKPFPEVDSGYNYARIYRYLGQYYDMSRLLENDKINDDTLAKCDVLVIKTPTERYSPEEAAAVVRFVENGGGLLLIGDHTNYERSATIMNDMTRPMGFIFRDDVLFSFGESPDEQLYVKPAVSHPAVQHVPHMDFAVSCSIDPGSSHGRPVLVNTGLWSMGPEYHHENFLPVPNHCPEMRYGAFVQAWAARHGQGRAIAFTDSTVFSNFCVGQPGKSEVMLGMVEWLNHGNAWLDPRPWLIVVGLLPLGAGVWMAMNQRRHGVWLVLLAAGTCGWTLASLAAVGTHRWAMPAPECLRPERCVVIDRTTSTVPLSKGPYTRGGGKGFGLFEQWLARLDCRTVRKAGHEALSGDVLVAIYPSRPTPDQFRQELEQYVNDGGRLLVVDSPENRGSTANSLLFPFGLSLHHDRLWKGKLLTAVKLPEAEVAQACEVGGGQPVARIGPYPVAAVASYGRGSVMAIGFGSLWNDKGMGETWGIEASDNGKPLTEPTAEGMPAWTLDRDAEGKLVPRLEQAMSPGWMLEPNPAVKARYNVMFGLLRPFFDGKPWPVFPPPAAEKKDAGKKPVLKEAGPAEL
jgi:hypothetical protein